MTPVWIHIDPTRQYPWHILRRAIPGGRVSTLCLDGDGYAGAQSYGPLLVSTEHPAGMACPACERHLAVTMQGAAVAVEMERVAIARVETEDLRGPRALDAGAEGEWT